MEPAAEEFTFVQAGKFRIPYARTSRPPSSSSQWWLGVGVGGGPTNVMGACLIPHHLGGCVKCYWLHQLGGWLADDVSHHWS
jgi:hypothetical protein